jgi:hypothetical protein
MPTEALFFKSTHHQVFVLITLVILYGVYFHQRLPKIEPPAFLSPLLISNDERVPSKHGARPDTLQVLKHATHRWIAIFS